MKQEEEIKTESNNQTITLGPRLNCPEELKHFFGTLNINSKQGTITLEMEGQKTGSEYYMTLKITGSKYDLLEADKFDHFEVYETITSSLEKFQDFKLETISFINGLDDLKRKFKDVSFFQEASVDSEKKIQASEKLVGDIQHLNSELRSMKGNNMDYSHKNPKTLEDIELIELYLTIIEDCGKEFPDFLKGKTFEKIEVDLKSYKEMPMNFWLKREKNLLKLEKNTEILLDISKDINLLKNGRKEFTSHLNSMESQIFGGLYNTLWKNLKYLPPDVVENSVELQINSDLLKKRLLNIQIVITDTIKSHSIIHVNDELKKQVDSLKKENEKLKKLIEIVYLRSCLENAVFNIKSEIVNDPKKGDDTKTIKMTHKTTVGAVLETLSLNKSTDSLWTKAEGETIGQRKISDIRKGLNEIYGQLSEVIHDPHSLELDIEYPIVVKASHVGDSPKRLLALKEIIQTNHSDLDTSGNKILKFE